MIGSTRMMQSMQDSSIAQTSKYNYVAGMQPEGRPHVSQTSLGQPKSSMSHQYQGHSSQPFHQMLSKNSQSQSFSTANLPQTSNVVTGGKMLSGPAASHGTSGRGHSQNNNYA